MLHHGVKRIEALEKARPKYHCEFLPITPDTVANEGYTPETAESELALENGTQTEIKEEDEEWAIKRNGRKRRSSTTHQGAYKKRYIRSPSISIVSQASDMTDGDKY